MTNMSPENECEYIERHLHYLREIEDKVTSIRTCAMIVALSTVFYGAWIIALLRALSEPAP